MMCNKCGIRVAVEDRKACQQCLDYSRLFIKERIEKGMCIQCPHYATPGKRFCAVCAEKRKDYGEIYKKVDGEDYFGYTSEIHRRREERASFCMWCIFKPEPGKRLCATCQRKLSEWSKIKVCVTEENFYV